MHDHDVAVSEKLQFLCKLNRLNFKDQTFDRSCLEDEFLLVSRALVEHRYVIGLFPLSLGAKLVEDWDGMLAGQIQTGLGRSWIVGPHLLNPVDRNLWSRLHGQAWWKNFETQKWCTHYQSAKSFPYLIAMNSILIESSLVQDWKLVQRGMWLSEFTCPGNNFTCTGQ